MQWRFLDTGARSGEWNMALDAAMVRGGYCALPTLRVFRWQPFCISLGYHQDAGEIALDRCRAAGREVVRRPTAGRAILHAEELTYSVVIPAGHPWYQELPLELYRRLSEAIAAGLRLLGVAAQFAPGERLYHDGRPLRLSCFATAARNEITVMGRKVVGSAQRRFREGTLQHGSILLRDGHEQLIDFLAGSPASLEVERGRLQDHTDTLQRVCGREITHAEMRAALREGFSRVLGAAWEEGEVLPEEHALTEVLREQYRILTINPQEIRLCES